MKGSFMSEYLLPVHGEEVAFSPIERTVYKYDNLKQAGRHWNAANLQQKYVISDNMSYEDITLANNELVKGTLIFQSPSHALDVLNASKQMGLKFIETIKTVNPMLHEGEFEHWNKMILQRRNSAFYFLETGSPDPIKPSKRWLELSDKFARFLMDRAWKVLGTFDPYTMMISNITPLVTNSGAPLCTRDPSLRLLSAKFYGFTSLPTIDEIYSSHEYMYQRLGYQDLGPFPVVTGKRSGVKVKNQKEYYLTNDYQVICDYETIAARCNTRTINMADCNGAKLSATGAYPLKIGLMSCPHFHHTNINRMVTREWFYDSASKKKKGTETDKTGYDNTISPHFRFAMHDSVAKAMKFPWYSDFMRLMEFERAILHPTPYGRGLVNKIMKLYGLLSGDPATSSSGSYIHMVTLMEVLEEMDLWVDCTGEFKLNDLPRAVIQSDDAVLPYSFDEAQTSLYSSLMLEHGFVDKIMPNSLRFLMKHNCYEKEYAILARIVQQTLSNEHDVNHVGQLLIGFASRLSGDIHPLLKPLFKDWYMNILVKETAFGRLNIEYNDNLKEMTRSIMAHPQVNKFLVSAEGMAWAEGIIYDAGFKESARMTLEIMVKSGYEMSDMTAAKDYHVAFTNALIGGKQEKRNEAFHLYDQIKARTG